MRTDESLSKHCSFGTGGKAKVYVEPDSLEELIEIITFCKDKKIKFFILGNGTNVVFEDKGFSGVVICVKRLNKIQITNEIVVCECGVNLYYLNQILSKNSLFGMEFSYGIPGTVGGAVIQNAGAFGGEIKDVFLYAVVLRDNKIVVENDFWFKYRNSSFKENKDILLKIALKLEKNDKKVIKNLQNENLSKRMKTQPYKEKSAGSVFKRQREIIPAKMIDILGLKSVRIGDVEVSSIHANFIVNKGAGKSKDFKKLIRLIKRKVYKKFKVKLKEEIEFVGG